MPATLNASLITAPRYAFGAFAVVLLALALAFPYFGTRARIHDRFDPAQGTGNNGMTTWMTPCITDQDPGSGPRRAGCAEVRP